MYCTYRCACVIIAKHIISQHFCVAEKSEKHSRKRKLLKADQLLLPESKIKPVGSKQRKVKEKNRQAKTPSDSSDSEDEEEKRRPAAIKTNNNHRTVATFDLWKTEGNLAVQNECIFQQLDARTCKFAHFIMLLILLRFTNWG